MTTRSPMQLLALQMVLPQAPVPVPVAFAVVSHATSICTAPVASALPALPPALRPLQMASPHRTRTARAPRRPPDQKEITREEEPSCQRSRL